MKFFVDSADQQAVVGLLEAGLVSGVTSNPMILDRAGLDQTAIPRLLEAYLEAGAEEVLFQSWGREKRNLIETGRYINALDARTTVKVPATREGFEAAKVLVGEGVPVLLTAVHTVTQALVAASMGVKYITPFIGRLNESGFDGLRIAEQIAALTAGTGLKVLIGSVRSARDVHQIALTGHDFFTAGPAVIEDLIASRETDEIAEIFEALADKTAVPA